MSIITLQNVHDWLGLTTTAEDGRLELMRLGVDAALKAKCGDIELTTYPGAASGGEGDSGLYRGNGTRYLFLRQYPVNRVVVTGTTVSGSTTVTAVSSVTRLFASQSITGTGIPASTTISSVGASSIVLSQAATANGTGVSLETGLAVWSDPTGRFDVNPDGSFSSATLLVEGTDYVLHTDGCIPGTTTKCSYEGRLERLSAVWDGVYVRRDNNLNRGAGDAAGNIKIAYNAGYPTVPADLVMAALKMISWIRKTSASGGVMESERYEDYEYHLAKGGEAITQAGGVTNMIQRYRRRFVA